MNSKNHYNPLHIKFAAVALFFLAFMCFPHRSNAATLDLVSSKQATSIGEEFNIDIHIDSENTSINAAQAVLQFSPDSVTAVKVDKSNSVFNFWLQEPTINNTAGTVSFIGGSPAGFSGKSLQVLRVTFKVKGSGVITITLNDAAVTASDGSGTNVLSSTKGIEIKSLSKAEIQKITPSQINRDPETAANAPAKPVVTIPLYPNSESWYNTSSDFSATWNLPRDITAVSAVINKIPTTIPSVSDGLFDNKSFSALDNGIWYLHVRFKNNIGWGVTNHYRIAVDTVPPLPFTIEVDPTISPDNPTPELRFESKDQFSGILNYSVQVDQLLAVQTEKNSFIVDPLPPGTHIVKILASDKAQNKTESSITLNIVPIASPQIISVSQNVYVGEGGLTIAGTSLPMLSILINVKDTKGNVVYSAQAVSAENGAWSQTIDQPLKKGTYYMEVVAKDSRGAMSFPVKSENIQLKERPVLVIAGISLTYKGFVIALIIILLITFFLGFWTKKVSKENRQKRILIAQRDVNSQLLNIEKDINKLLEEHKPGGKIDETVENEVNYILKKISDNIAKNKNYILENIEEIE